MHLTFYFCRTLYEEEDQDSFHESLALRIRSHEKDIEKMCNKNYQGFIESVSELLKVRSDAAKLKVSPTEPLQLSVELLFDLISAKCRKSTSQSRTLANRHELLSYCRDVLVSWLACS